MQLGSLHHVGIVVPDLDETLRRQIALTDAHVFVPPRETGDGMAVIAFLERAGMPLLEIIQPLDAAVDLVAFLDRNPDGGLHHLCYRTPEIQACRESLASAGMRFATPIVMGILGSPIFFIHAAAAGGILTEVIELPE